MSQPPLSPTPTISASSARSSESPSPNSSESSLREELNGLRQSIVPALNDSTQTPRPGYALRATSRLGRFLQQISSSKTVVLQFDGAKQCLSEWKWPFDPLRMALISPMDLGNHCATHAIQGPCCLCPLKDRTHPTFAEASFSVATDPDHLGEPLASCSRSFCGYTVLLMPIFNHLRLGSHVSLLKSPGTLEGPSTIIVEGGGKKRGLK
ncbi:hypothetical protein Hypma_007800 [Hypsizygus marmoreus]|uniref:Uncharacterized protein n=1 Tax=Hypsizygus marmoreus TaxID=39966 RepID=A0A369JUP4_HYPMA|nr:hypothetical protein Hypma_007800 [Hypsizygus marmoreus]